MSETTVVDYKERSKELQDKLDVMLVVIKNWRERYEKGEEDVKKSTKKYRFDMDVMNKELKTATAIIEKFKEWKKEEAGYDDDTAMISSDIVKKITSIINEVERNDA